MAKFSKSKIRNLIQEVLTRGPFNGCRWEWFDNSYALVFAWDKDEDSGMDILCGKVAYNCDSLQCDYAFDWYMPDGYDTEMCDCAGKSVEELYDFFVDAFKKL